MRRPRSGLAVLAAVVGGVSPASVSLRAQAPPAPCPTTEVTFYLASPQAQGGALELVAYTGETLEIGVIAHIRSSSSEPDDWIQSFALSVAHDREALTLLSAALNMDEVPELSVGGAINGVHPVENATGAGFVGHHVGLCGGETACWLPAVSDSPVVEARYGIVLPPRGHEPVGPPVRIETTIEFRDGLQGPGQPILNAVTLHGATKVPCMEHLTLRIEVLESREFVRGDANFDQRIDISDPVTLLRSKFFGDATVHCDDAGDSNDDGVLDISDAVYTFNYLFIGGASPPPPFPARGSDPSPDDLRCRPPES